MARVPGRVNAPPGRSARDRGRKAAVFRDPPFTTAGDCDIRSAPWEAPGVRPFVLELDPTVHVIVRDNNVDQALRALKKKMQREGIFREMKLRRNYEKPSERRAREKAEAVRRHRKLLRKRMEREGF